MDDEFQISISDSLSPEVKTKISDLNLLNRLTDFGYFNRSKIIECFKYEFDKLDSEKRYIIGFAYSGLGRWIIIAIDNTLDSSEKGEKIFFKQNIGGSNEIERRQNFDNVLNFQNVKYMTLLDYIKEDFGRSMDLYDSYESLAEPYFDKWLNNKMTWKEISNTIWKKIKEDDKNRYKK